jgi:hypothetical protein
MEEIARIVNGDDSNSQSSSVAGIGYLGRKVGS